MAARSDAAPKLGRRRYGRLWLAAGCLMLVAAGFFAAHSLIDSGARQQVRTTDGADRIDVTGRQVTRGEKDAALQPELSGDGSFDDALLALAANKAGVVTVLHLGDSHIAADRISRTLRVLLQEKFGDGGRGLMMPGFPFPYYQADGFHFEKTGDWRAANSLTDAGIYGVTGVSLTASDPESVLTAMAEKAPFAEAGIAFLAGPGLGKATVTGGGENFEVDTASDTARVAFVKLPGGTGFSVAPAGDEPITLLGVSTSSGKPGVRYVNLGIPGASALTTAKWSDSLVADDIAHLAPQLVVLGYGTNEGFQDGLDLKAYETAYRHLVAVIRQAAPNASLLILGPMDGAKLPAYGRFEGSQSLPCRPLSSGERADYAGFVEERSDALMRWYPPPKLSEVRALLQNLAAELGADYIDLAAAMGGDCAIDRWAKAEPPLARPDHVHLTDAGYEKLAGAIYGHLIDGYEAYRKAAFPTGSIGGRETAPDADPAGGLTAVSEE